MSRSAAVAIIGAGHLGTFHARALRRLTGAPPDWIVDSRPERAARLAKEVGGQAESDLERVLAARPAVVVATPTETHAAIAGAALKAGCHVLVEKPITRTLAEGEALVAQAAAAGRTLHVGHTERFNPIFRALADGLGTPAFVEAERLAPFVPRSLDVDIVLDLMIHDLDLVLSVVPAEVEAVDALGVAVLTPREDIATAQLRFANGTVAHLTASRVSQEKSRKIRFFGRAGYVSIDLLRRTARRVAIRPDSRGPWEVPGRGRFGIDEQRLEQATPDPLEAELGAFLEAVGGGKPAAVTGTEALRVLRVATEIERGVRASLARLAAGGLGPQPVTPAGTS